MTMVSTRGLRSCLISSLLAGTAMFAGATGASAQDAPAQETAAAEDDSSVITVTARRRDESIVDVPLAITVVTSEKLDKLNIRSTSELANYVPGLQFSDFTPGNSRNDRGGNRPLIFRGLNLANNGGVTGAGSMFLDGAAVIGNEIPGGMDIGAVEVLRGPQNVYFGRASMTGAVSYRTKAIPDEWRAAFEATIAERDTKRFEASVAGPLVPGLIGIRVTGLTESKDGYITNGFNNGASPKQGAQSRDSISATLEFTPSDALKIKLYGNYFEDEDGISATVKILPDSPTGTGRVTNCLRGITNGGVTRRATICGKVPDRSLAENFVSTFIPPRDAAFIFAIPFLQNENFKKQVGLQRNVLNLHGVLDYQISDYLKFQSITGYHTNATQQVSDGIQQSVKPGALYSVYILNLANKFNDFSQEFRLSSDPERAFSWTVGANYVKARNQGTAVTTFTTASATAFAAPNNFVGAFVPTPQNLGDDRARTYGVFAGAYLKLFENKLTLSAEGRYQIDKRRTITRSGVTQGVLSDVDGKFESFNPRVSIDYDVGGNRKIYASYAVGSRPGGFNAGLLVYYDPTNVIYTRTTPAPLDFQTVTTSIAQTFGVTDPSYDEEKLTIGELGFKGSFDGGKGYFDINAYYGIVSNQQLRQSLLVPALGFSLAATSNDAKTKIYGVEFTGNYSFNRQLSISTTFAWNHAVRVRFLDPAPATIALFGFSDFSGLELPNTPEFSGSAVLSYEDDISEKWEGFGSLATVYRGKQWADLGNFAYIPGRATVDLRAGIRNETFSIEGFVTNLLDNRTYPGGNVAPDFGGNPLGQFSGFAGAYAEPRTFGMRFGAKF
jgi:iron complex outermembrane recepter protein